MRSLGSLKTPAEKLSSSGQMNKITTNMRPIPAAIPKNVNSSAIVFLHQLARSTARRAKEQMKAERCAQVAHRATNL